MRVRIDVAATHSFSVEIEARSIDAAIKRLDRDLADQARDPNNPLQSFTICSAEALNDIKRGAA